MTHVLGSHRGGFLAVSLSVAVVLAVAAAVRAQQPGQGTQSPGLIFGQEPKAGIGHEPGKANSPTDIRQTNPGFLVRADVNRGLRSYREGDALSITVAAEADAYVYVLYRQADGQVFLVYPNAQQPNNRVKARQAVKIPGESDTFRWVVGAPFGKESIKVLASKEPLGELSDPAMRAKFFNPVATKSIKGIQLELGKPSVAWAEDNVDLDTYQANAAAEDRSGARRIGLFIGLGQYEHIVRTQKNTEGKSVNVYQPSHRDARMLAGVLQEVGQLNKARIITNDEATRANVEEAVTQWLPSTARPGDTVVLYFSGIGMPASQAAGVQSKEVLLPLYDFMTAGTYKSLQEQRTAGKISSSNKQQLAVAEEVASQSGTQDEAALAVVRRWAISEDLFAHWLQGLAGRQVVVVLDAPYASAFAPQDGAAGPMSGGVARLVNLGQQDIALLGACGEQLFDVQRDPQGLSLMTELLIQSIQATSGSLTLDEAHTMLATRMESRLNQINQALRADGKEPLSYKPYLVNRCKKPVLLKP